MNGSDKNVGSIEKLIEELTKVRPDELSKGGLKLFEYINEIIDRNKELKEENKILKGNYYTLCVDIQMVTSELGFPEDTIIADEFVSMIKENYIEKSLVEEKIEKLEEKAKRIAGTYQYADSGEDLENKKKQVIELRTKAEGLQDFLEGK